MHSVEKLFAVVDRKVDAFDFSIKKVKGKITGNEYYAVSAACIINGENFEKKVLTIGCPKGAVESIVRAMINALGSSMYTAEGTPNLKKVEAPVETKVTLSIHKDVADEVAPGLRKITPTVTETVEEVDENEYDEVDEDICEECGEFVDECTCDEIEAPKITLTPAADRKGPQDCPYCSAKVAPNFAYCPMCGGQQ